MSWSEIAAGAVPANACISQERSKKSTDGDGAIPHARRVGQLTTFSWLAKIGVRGGAAR
jgi:hypothetical protein